jgi:phosphoserine phosphatase
VFRAVLFDLDGTLTPVRSVWQHIHETLGLWEEEARRHQEAFQSGAIDYEEFCARDAAHWAGRRESELRAIADRIPYRPGARELVDAAREAGALVGVVSTGLTLLADRVHRELGLAFTIANRLVAERGVLTGAVKVNVEHARKGDAVELFCRQFGVAPEEVVSVGDSDGDISMFERTGMSVAVHPASRRTAAAATLVHKDGSLAVLLDRLPIVRRRAAGAPEKGT